MFDDMIANVEANKKLSPIVTELLLRGRKLNLFLYHNLILKYLKSVKSCGKNINLHSLMIKLLNAKTTIMDLMKYLTFLMKYVLIIIN